MAFHLHRDGTSTTFAVAELREMAHRGDLPQDEYIYVDEKGEWLAAGQLPELTGAWNIEENEATVAVQLTPEMLAAMAGMPVPTLDAVVPASAPPETPPGASGLSRAADRPGAIAAKAAQAADDASDSIPTAFMELPDQLKGVAPPPAKSAAKVVLKPALVQQEEEEAATAYMTALPADLHAKATGSARKADPTPAASPKVKVAASVGAIQPQASAADARKALMLSIAGGLFGADRFYLGHTGLGVVKLLATGVVLASWLVAIPLVAQVALTAALLVGWLTDISLIATGKTTDAQGKPLKR